MLQCCGCFIYTTGTLPAPCELLLLTPPAFNPIGSPTLNFKYSIRGDLNCVHHSTFGADNLINS